MSWVKHSVFWIVYWVTQSLLMSNNKDLGFYLAKNLSMVVIQIFVVYFNLFVLIPWVYRKGKVILYLVLGLILIYLSYGLSFHCIQFVLNTVHGFIPSIHALEFPDSMLSFQFDFWQLFSGSVPYSLAFVCSSAYFLTKSNAIQEKEKSWLLLEKNKTELQFLKSQISPHFLFNSLNNLHYLIGKDQELSMRYTVKLSEILRYIVYNSKEEAVLLDHELKHLDAYVELMKMSIEQAHRINFQNTIPPNKYVISPLMLLTIIENGFKHSGIKYKDSAELNISLELSGQQLVLTMRNTIEVHKSTSTGNNSSLVNLKKRLELLYRDKHDFVFEIKNEKAFTSLMIELE